MDLNSTDSNFQDIHERQPLLKQRGIITMPYYMDYDSFKEVAWALDFWKFDSVLSGRPIIKFIGNGGNFSATTAIGELMRDYNAIGILAGGSYSGHTIAFMMCPERYVYDSAYFGIHSASIYPTDRPYTNADFRIEAETHDYLDNQVAQLFAKESQRNKFDAAYWKKIHEEARLSTKLISGLELVHQYGLAKSMLEFPQDELWRIGRGNDRI